MIFRRAITFIILISMMVFFSGCRLNQYNQDTFQQYGSSGLLRVGLVLENPGPGAENINGAVLAGTQRAITDAGAALKVLNPGDLINDTESIRYLAENQYDLVIAVGKGMQVDLNIIAPEYPDVKFAIFGGEVDQPNVASISFNKEEGAFLAGVAAASLTKTGTVGYIGGSMIGDKSAESAFAKGIQYINITEGQQKKAIVSYAGITSKAALDSQRAVTLANNIFWSGADIIFSSAGQIPAGVAKAAVENRRYALGGNQVLMNTFPWNVLGITVEKQENAVFTLVSTVLKGKFNQGKVMFGLREGAVDFVSGPNMSVDVSAKLQLIKKGIKDGQIKPNSIKVPQFVVNQLNQMPVDFSEVPPVGSKPTGS